jgi:hypothetical protein
MFFLLLKNSSPLSTSTPSKSPNLYQLNVTHPHTWSTITCHGLYLISAVAPPSSKKAQLIISLLSLLLLFAMEQSTCHVNYALLINSSSQPTKSDFGGRGCALEREVLPPNRHVYLEFSDGLLHMRPPYSSSSSLRKMRP